MTSTSAQPGEEQQDRAIRPQRLSDYVGQEHVKRAIEVAVAGGHNVLMLWSITPASVCQLAIVCLVKPAASKVP